MKTLLINPTDENHQKRMTHFFNAQIKTNEPQCWRARQAYVLDDKTRVVFTHTMYSFPKKKKAGKETGKGKEKDKGKEKIETGIEKQAVHIGVYSDFKPIGKGAWGTVMPLKGVWCGKNPGLYEWHNKDRIVKIGNVSGIDFKTKYFYQREQKHAKNSRLQTKIPCTTLEEEILLQMQFFEGITLFDLINKLILNTHYLTTRQLMEINCKLLKELKDILDKGILHCDIKPDNIIIKLKPEIEVTIIDYGLAQKKEKCTKRFCITNYGDPELLNETLAHNNAEADLFSMILCISELWGDYSRRAVYKNIKDDITKWRDGAGDSLTKEARQKLIKQLYPKAIKEQNKDYPLFLIFDQYPKLPPKIKREMHTLLKCSTRETQNQRPNLDEVIKSFESFYKSLLNEEKERFDKVSTTKNWRKFSKEEWLQLCAADRTVELISNLNQANIETKKITHLFSYVPHLGRKLRTNQHRSLDSTDNPQDAGGKQIPTKYDKFYESMRNKIDVFEQAPEELIRFLKDQKVLKIVDDACRALDTEWDKKTLSPSRLRFLLDMGATLFEGILQEWAERRPPEGSPDIADWFRMGQILVEKKGEDARNIVIDAIKNKRYKALFCNYADNKDDTLLEHHLASFKELDEVCDDVINKSFTVWRPLLLWPQIDDGPRCDQFSLLTALNQEINDLRQHSNPFFQNEDCQNQNEGLLTDLRNAGAALEHLDAQRRQLIQVQSGIPDEEKLQKQFCKIQKEFFACLIAEELQSPLQQIIALRSRFQQSLLPEILKLNQVIQNHNQPENKAKVEKRKPRKRTHHSQRMFAYSPPPSSQNPAGSQKPADVKHLSGDDSPKTEKTQKSRLELLYRAGGRLQPEQPTHSKNKCCTLSRLILSKS